MALVNRDTPLGFQLPPVSNQMSLEKWIRREELQQEANPGFHPSKNIHTDVEAAKKEGLEAPVAGGPFLASHISRMMLSAFGEGWVKGGKLSVRFVRPVFPTDFITARAVVTEKKLENSRVRVVCEVWVEKAGGEKVVVGTASGLVD
ncbi:MAG: MaoC family dehydratase [Ardenticatenaceae bacterium]|nr:MaoC family dehydratase [Ardenticatenaceae bacterium]